MNIKRALVTGGTGYLGERIVQMLIENRVSVIAMTRGKTLEILQKTNGAELIQIVYGNESFESIIERYEVELVVHCATNYGRNQSSPIEIGYTNLIMPLEILHAGSKVGLKHFLNTDTILDKRINGYSLSKAHFREWLAMYSEKLHCVNVSLEHFYGPGDNSTKFVTNIIKSLINENDKIDLTLGEQKRDFIYIDDVVEAFRTIIRTLDNNKLSGLESYEVGSGTNVSIKDFVILAKAISGNIKTKLIFGAMPYRHNEVMQSNVDIQKLKNLGWMPTTSLDVGLEKTISYERLLN